MSRRASLLFVTLVLVLTGCSNPVAKETSADKLTPPKLGACRNLTPKAAEGASDPTDPVACSKPHTAETFAIGTLPKETGSSYDAKRHGQWIHATCSAAFGRFIGADESLAMRVRLSWVWFRPSEAGWKKGARWYRCDAVGGPVDATTYAKLPTTAKGLFSARPPEEWLLCAQGQTVTKSKKVNCTEKHNWRAVTTIKLGQPTDPYPGDRLVQVRSRDFCQDSVGAWMNYPPEYDFGYTWFHQGEWTAGNRRSVCWAKTPR